MRVFRGVYKENHDKFSENQNCATFVFMEKIYLRPILRCLILGVAWILSAAGVSVPASEVSERAGGREGEDLSCVAELNRLFSKIYESGEEARWNASDSFVYAARKVMEAYAGEEFPFDKIRNINYYKADNGSFRMLNWGVPETSGTVTYKALLQVHRQTKDDYIIYELNDMSAYYPYPEGEVLTPESWWGAFYYQCIEKKVDNRTYYTFLGWNSGNPLYQQSVIEVMRLKPDGGVEFGASLFANKGRVPGSERMDKTLKDYDIKRIVFRFSRKGGMILRYDYQGYIEKNAKGKKVERKADMIIFDVLAPQQTAMSDDHAYYVPLGGKYQAYVFQENKWRLKGEVQARNPEKRIKGVSSRR